MKSNKILNILVALIAVVGAGLFVNIFLQDSELLQSDGALQNKVISPIIYFSTFLLFAAIIIAILLSLWSIIRNPENLKKTLLGLAILGIVLVFAYFFADSNAVLDTQGNVLPNGGEAGSSINKWVGTGIWYSIALGFVAFVFFVYDLLKGLVKS
jgi:glucan phosphoethanolaminetransferase (alkaline phosphatase superfamily)